MANPGVPPSVQLDNWTREGVEATCDDFLTSTMAAAKAAAQQLLTVTEELEAAQHQLRSQAGNVQLVATTVYTGLATMEHLDLPRAWEQVQAATTALSTCRAAAAEAGRKAAQALEAIGKPHQIFQVAGLAAAALHKRHNSTRCPLLALPDTALQSIAHKSGPVARLVCQHLRDAYQGHLSSVKWSYYSSRKTRQQQVTALPAEISTWRWRAHLQRLVVADPGHSTPLALLADIANSLPSLQHLACSWPECHNGTILNHPPTALTDLWTLSTPQPRSTPRLQQSELSALVQPLTALTSLTLGCTERWEPANPLPTSLALVPVLAPRLADLQIDLHPKIWIDPESSSHLTALSRTLTNLHLHANWHPAAAEQHQEALCSLLAACSSLRSLQLTNVSVHNCPHLHAAVVALPHLTSLEHDEYGCLEFDESLTRCSLPPCSLLPRLRRLHLQHGNAALKSATHMASWLQAAAPASSDDSGLHELYLPDLGCLTDSLDPEAPQALSTILAAVQSHTGLTSLSASVGGTQYRHCSQPPARFLADLGTLHTLRNLLLDNVMLPDLVAADGAWGALSALTCFSITLVKVKAESDVAIAPVAQRAIAQLGNVLKATLRLQDGWIPDNEISAYLKIRKHLLMGLAELPRLQSLDISQVTRQQPCMALMTQDILVLAEGQVATSLRQLVLDKASLVEVDLSGASFASLLQGGLRVEWVGG